MLRSRAAILFYHAHSAFLFPVHLLVDNIVAWDKALGAFRGATWTDTNALH